MFAAATQPYCSCLLSRLRNPTGRRFRAMPNVKANKGLKRTRCTSGAPISFEFQMTVRGGHLKTPTVIPIDVAMHGGTECRFTAVSTRTPWLCEMVSGVRQWSCPLKGASIVRRLKHLLAEATATAVLTDAPVMDDKMAGLLGSDDEQPAAKPPVKYKKIKADAETPTVIVVSAPASATAEDEGTTEPRKVLLLRLATGRFGLSSTLCRGSSSNCNWSCTLATMDTHRKRPYIGQHHFGTSPRARGVHVSRVLTAKSLAVCNQ